MTLTVRSARLLLAPLGIAVGVYLSEVGRDGKFAAVVRFVMQEPEKRPVSAVADRDEVRDVVEVTGTIRPVRPLR